MSDYGDGARAMHASSDSETVISSWLEELVEQYRAKAQTPQLTRPVLLTFSALAGLAALTPALLQLDRAAYPQEPEKERALEICSRTDPTFLRFLANERESCYERINDVVNRAANTMIAAHSP